MAAEQPAVCARCGAEFGCGASASECWCQDVRLEKAARTELARSYDGCLCPACLEEVARGQPSSVPVR